MRWFVCHNAFPRLRFLKLRIYVPSPPKSGETICSASARTWPTLADRPDEGAFEQGHAMQTEMRNFKTCASG
jgi:hypothetical protein